MTCNQVDDRIESARALAVRALGVAGRSAEGLELVRWGTNAVFRSVDAVVRLAERDYDRGFLRQQLQLSDWLIKRGYPTARLCADAVLSGHPVTVWERIPEVREPTMADLAWLARGFHDLSDDYAGDLPAWEPLGRLGSRMDRMEPDAVISAPVLARLRSIKDHLVGRVREIEFVLPPGPIHGDIHRGNVLVNGVGPHLIDFDRIAWGPREWDLVEPLAGLILFGEDRTAWRSFTEVYGMDLTDWEPWEDLLRLRGMFMFSWLLTLERTPEVALEIERRIRYFLEPEAPLVTWSPV